MEISARALEPIMVTLSRVVKALDIAKRAFARGGPAMSGKSLVNSSPWHTYSYEGRDYNPYRLGTLF
jgi:hypothetical protein